MDGIFFALFVVSYKKLHLMKGYFSPFVMPRTSPLADTTKNADFLGGDFFGERVTLVTGRNVHP